MGCIKSKAAAFEEEKDKAEEAAMGPPSKVMESSEYSQDLVMILRPTLEVHLGTRHLDNLKATQMITRQVSNGDDGTMYYIKAKTGLADWPWIFVKIWSPPTITGVSPAQFKRMKKMDQEYKLVTF